MLPLAALAWATPSSLPSSLLRYYPKFCMEKVFDTFLFCSSIDLLYAAAAAAPAPNPFAPDIRLLEIAYAGPPAFGESSEFSVEVSTSLASSTKLGLSCSSNFSMSLMISMM